MTKAQCCVVLRTKSMHAARTKFDFQQNDVLWKIYVYTRIRTRSRTRTGWKWLLFVFAPCALPFRSFSLMMAFSIIKRYKMCGRLLKWFVRMFNVHAISLSVHLAFDHFSCFVFSFSLSHSHIFSFTFSSSLSLAYTHSGWLFVCNIHLPPDILTIEKLFKRWKY